MSNEVFTEFQLGEHTVPVVPSFDDLPRASRRLLRDTLRDSSVQRELAAGPRMQLGVDYALAYAQTQGVIVSLASIEDDDEYDRVREQAMLAGFRLIAHFQPVGETKKAGKAKPKKVN